MNNLVLVGCATKEISMHVRIPVGTKIYKSSGLKKHIVKRHPDCTQYIRYISDIISSPDYIGVNPNGSGTSFELIKTYSDNVQIGIKLDVKDNYFYVATLHTVTNAKISSRLKSGRLKIL